MEQTPAENKASKVDEVDRYMMIDFDKDKVMSMIIREKQRIDESRAEWYRRKLEYLYQWDNFVDYKHAPVMEGQPYFHIPVTHEKMQAWHARMYKTITSLDPMFTVRPLNDVSLQEVMAVKAAMQWYLRDEINQEQGIKPVLDELLWDLGSDGWACLYKRWDIIQRQFLDLVPNLDVPAFREEAKDLNAELAQAKKRGRPPGKKKFYKEITKVITTFSGVILETIPHECMYFPEYIPTSGDMNYPSILIMETIRTEEDYIRGKQQGTFNPEAVDICLQKGKGLPDDEKSNLRQERRRLQGIGDTMEYRTEEYGTDIVFLRADLDEDSVMEEYVFTVNIKAKQFLKETFLDRMCRNGKRPVYKFDLMKRPRSAYSRGFPEMLYSLNAEVDDFHNIRRASGLVANIPWGFYRASSGLDKEAIEVAPGKFYPVDDPATDVKAMNFPNVTSWALQEEQLAQSYADRLTAMPSYMQGVVAGPVGPLRSNSGLQSLLQEAQLPLDVYLDRFRVTFNKLLQGILSDLGTRLDPIIWLKVLGENGEPLFDQRTGQMIKEPIAREYLTNGRYKFDIAANDAQFNPEKERQDALAVGQMLITQMAVQTGIVTPENMYYIYRDMLDKTGKREIDKYITRPQMSPKPLNLYGEITSITNGHMPMIVLNDDHQQKIAGLMAFVESEDYQLGKQQRNIHPLSDQLFNQAIQTHQKYLDMLGSMPAMPNQSGLEMPVTMGARQAGVGPGQSQQDQQAKQSGGMNNGSAKPQAGAGAAVPNAGMAGAGQARE
jgi:hypothetical protein